MFVQTSNVLLIDDSTPTHKHEREVGECSHNQQVLKESKDYNFVLTLNGMFHLAVSFRGSSNI